MSLSRYLELEKRVCQLESLENFDQHAVAHLRDLMDGLWHNLLDEEHELLNSRGLLERS